MAAPHERCSPLATEAMRQLGFEALAIDRANPWRFRPPAEKPLAGWELAEFVSGGLPVFRREGIDVSLEDLTLRAFLGQPLVLYGHHDDLSEGPERLAEIAARINRLGDVRWTSLGEIARSNALVRQVESTLTVRMYSTRVRLSAPTGVDQVEIELPRFEGVDRMRISVNGSPTSLEVRNTLARSQPCRVDGEGLISVDCTGATDLGLDASLDLSTPLALPRRLLSEIRDRAQPVGYRAWRRAA